MINTTNLKAKLEDVFKEFEVYVLEAESVESERKLMITRETELREMEKRLQEVEKQQKQDKIDFEAQQSFNDKSIATLQLREAEIEKEKASLLGDKKEIEEREKLLQDKWFEISEREKKLIDAEALSPLKAELDKRESLITEREEADTKRKHVLDIREQRIEAREEQLKLDADI